VDTEGTIGRKDVSLSGKESSVCHGGNLLMSVRSTKVPTRFCSRS
jgi:hypothetical protein